MKRILFTLLVLIVCSYAFAQDANTIIANLKSDLQKNPIAKKKATIYSDLTWYYSTVSIDSALHYGSKAIQESKSLGDSTLIAQVHSDIGAVYFRKGDFGRSKENYLAAYRIRKARKDYRGLAKINNNLANIYERSGDYNRAMSSFLEALSYFESINDEKNCHTIRGNIGLILLKVKNYPKAQKYLAEVIQYQEQNNLSDGLCVSCLNLGNVYLQMRDTTNALRQYEKSLKACRAVGDKKGEASGYNNIASIKTEQRKSKEARQLYAKSLKAREALNSDLDKANFDLNLAKEYFDAKRYAEARDLLLNVERTFTKEGLNEKLQKNYKALIEVYGKLHKFDSVNIYVNKVLAVNTQILETSVIKHTAELEAKYETTKKEKLLLEKEVETRQKNQIIFTILVLLVLAIVIGYLISRSHKLKNKQLEQELQLKTALSKIETQNRLQEQRLSISRDLHDNIGSQLTFIISSIENIKYAFDIENSKLSDKLTTIAQFTRSTIVELRDTIWAMNREEISMEDLQSRITNFVEKAREATEATRFLFEIDDTLKSTTLSSVEGMNLYRTIQEAVNNSIKYSGATQISISISKNDKQIRISVKDNGIGFDSSNAERGNGLNNMQQRIESIGGEFTLQSSIDGGTQITILLNK